MITPIIKEDILQILHELKDSISLLEDKNILITGGTGMLGSYIVYTLIEANEQILKKPATLYIVTRRQKKPFGDNRNIHYLNIDIAKEIPQGKNIHYIIHAASKAAPKFYMVDRIDTINTNILGLYHLLQTTDKHLKSFLYFSSCDIYGEPTNSRPIKEDFIGQIDHLNTRSCYAEAKRACETICMNYFRERRLPVKIARIFHTFGPGLNLNDGRSFSDFISFGLEGNNIQILGDKNKKRAMLYVKDAAIMFLKLLLSKKEGEVYNIGSDKNIVSIGEFAEIVCSAFNNRLKEKIKVVLNKDGVGYYKGAVKAIRPDIYKFKNDFNYTPTTGIEEAVSRTIDHYLYLKNHAE